MKHKLGEMNKDERSLLIYLETCLVDHCGRVNQLKLNEIDRQIMDEWKLDKFIDFGRVASDQYLNTVGSTWVEFSASAWKLAHQERKARSERMLKDRNWLKTSELRDERE